MTIKSPSAFKVAKSEADEICFIDKVKENCGVSVTEVLLTTQIKAPPVHSLEQTPTFVRDTTSAAESTLPICIH